MILISAFVDLFGYGVIRHSMGLEYWETDTVLLEVILNDYVQQPQGSFKHRKHLHDTVLSKYISGLKDSDTDFSIKWSIVTRARSYKGNPSRCYFVPDGKALHSIS